MNYYKYEKNVIFYIFSKYKMHNIFFLKKTIVELHLGKLNYASNNIKAVGIFTTFAFLQQPCGRFDQSWEILDLEKTEIARTIKIS